MPRLTEEEAVAIARRFIGGKKEMPRPPIRSVWFRPASEDPTPGSARDRWFIAFDARKPGDRFVVDPCTFTVVVNDESGRARYQYPI